MAQVILESIYKSFSQRRGDKATRSTRPSNEDIPDDPSVASASAVSVLRRINLTVKDGEFMVLVGPSGCGKSTLLRLIAGLEQVTAGNIWVGDRLVNLLPPKQRDIAMVFQSYALYPHMTVYENLAFGLRRTAGQQASEIRDLGLERGMIRSGTPDLTGNLPSSRPDWLENLLVSATRSLPKGLHYWSDRERAIDQRVRLVAQMLQIDALLDRLPKQLSGGQKQRVALGRAMARNPQVFLMDEPLSNLDAKLRTETRSQIVNLQRQLGITTIYVTHDQTEAMTMGDRIAIMNAGQIQQVATPLDLYHRPANRFVAEFIGSPPMNFLEVQVKAPLLITHPQFRLTLPESWELNLRYYDGKTVILGVRPEHLHISPPAPKNLPVRIERVEALGSETYLSLRLVDSEAVESHNFTLQARIEPDRSVRVGEMLWFSMEADKIHLFDAASGEAIAPPL